MATKIIPSRYVNGWVNRFNRPNVCELLLTLDGYRPRDVHRMGYDLLAMALDAAVQDGRITLEDAEAACDGVDLRA